MRRAKSRFTINKLTLLMVASGFIAAILILRMFQLQIIKHTYYQDLATQGQNGIIELPAQRGEIIIKDYHSNEEFLLATNTTLNMIYADPALIKDPIYLGKQLAPLLFNLEDEREKETARITELSKSLPSVTTEEQRGKLLKKLSDEELENEFRKNLIESLGEKQRQQILLVKDLEPAQLAVVQKNLVNGVEIIDDDVYAYPPQISNPTFVAETIADYIEFPSKKLAQILKGENRYIVLKHKLSPNISDQIKELMKGENKELFHGLGMREEYFRYYPEASLAANVIGYVNRANVGQYGIESSFNTQLQGTPGKFEAKRDSIGRQITVGESVLQPAIDGDNIVLTIDRSVQLKTEQILEQAVKEYQADSGQVIIMQPQTGSVIAMAHYPSFDPNNFGEVFKRKEVNFTPEEIDELYPTKDPGIYYFYKNAITLDRYLIFEEKDDEGRSRYYRYENFVGPEAYHNKIVSWPYEPGSVFKTIAMAIGIDDGDITANTTYNDSGPVGVDWNQYKEEYDFEIKNSDGYFGLVNMKTVLAKSLNTGMTFIAKRIGGALFYSYLEKFGFLDRTDIEFDTEVTGKIEYFEKWTESELATHAFGQGLTVTMLQLANAISAIANGGVLMQPHVIEETHKDDGTIIKTDPHEIRRVVSEDTAAKMTAMLTYSTEEGVANRGQVPNHFVAGKTGTSQTYKHGKALSGVGTTIATFSGFGPVNDPQFVILVKFDRPKTTEWGSSTAAPTFSKIAEYLFDYYNIPPDK